MKEMGSWSDRSGFTLVEMMAAMLIMTVGLLGLLQAVIVALEHDTRKVLREEAVRLAEEQMVHFRFQAYSTDLPARTTCLFQREIRGGRRTFSMVRDYQGTGLDSRRLRVVMGWDYKGKAYNHEIFSIKSKRR